MKYRPEEARGKMDRGYSTEKRTVTGGEEEDKNTGLNTQRLINNETQVCTVKRPELETTAGRGTSILQNKTGNV